MRSRSLAAGLAVIVAALGLAAAVWATAQHTGHSSITCDAAEFSFTSFAAKPGNVVHAKVIVDGSIVFRGDFTWSGATSPTFSVPLHLTGDHWVEAQAAWDTNGEKGSYDSGRVKLHCGSGTTTETTPTTTEETTTTSTTTTAPTTTSETPPPTTTSETPPPAKGREGYCSVAGNTWPDGTPITPGTYLDLEIGQPDVDYHYAGAIPAKDIAGVGSTCTAPATAPPTTTTSSSTTTAATTTASTPTTTSTPQATPGPKPKKKPAPAPAPKPTVKARTTHRPSTGKTTQRSSELPYTGVSLGLYAALGLLLVGGGVALRRLGREA